MKKLFILFLLSLTISSFAQVSVRQHNNTHYNGNLSLTISYSGQQRFWLFVDEVLQNEQSVKSICIQNLSSGDYYVRVELDNKEHNCFGQYLNISRSKSFGIGQSNGFYGFAKAQNNARPELVMSLVVAGPEQQQPFGQQPPQNEMTAMDPVDYQQAYTQLKNESFDNTRLTLAKQIISRNRMSTTQITDICKLFSFENNALEFAKYAYAFCIDTNKYYIVNEAFKHESSKRELNEYIQK